MPLTALYNARAERECARDIAAMNATDRRETDECGVFSAGGEDTFRDGRMRQTASASTRSMVKILLLQFGLSTAVAVLFWGANGNVSGYSAALGGLICVLPNAFLATRLAMPRNPEAERPLMRAAFAGELGKLALTVAMFAGAFALVRPLAAGALFAGFIAGQFGTFAGLWLAKTDTRRMDDTSNKHGE